MEEEGSAGCGRPRSGNTAPVPVYVLGLSVRVSQENELLQKKYKTTDLVISSSGQEGCLRRAWHDLTFRKV